MTTEATELSITLKGTDPDGNSVMVMTRAGITEQQLVTPALPDEPGSSPAEPAPEPPAVEIPETPEPLAEPAPPGEPTLPPDYRRPEPPMPVGVQAGSGVVAPMAQQAQIPGLGNATGHQTTETASKFVPPKVTQAVRSMTLFRRTGGFR